MFSCIFLNLEGIWLLKYPFMVRSSMNPSKKRFLKSYCFLWRIHQYTLSRRVYETSKGYLSSHIPSRFLENATNKTSFVRYMKKEHMKVFRKRGKDGNERLLFYLHFPQRCNQSLHCHMIIVLFYHGNTL